MDTADGNALNTQKELLKTIQFALKLEEKMEETAFIWLTFLIWDGKVGTVNEHHMMLQQDED